jgi:hypothetical protein
LLMLCSFRFIIKMIYDIEGIADKSAKVLKYYIVS